ncbi:MULTISPECIES: glycosyltransferase family 4 protein [unclassified Mesorhizobium]|uniref:glycosyltransferase family 4 protein n=1 Tax=unclassified Mesorhizobium TaxID=325217 RepID=UPI00333DA460
MRIAQVSPLFEAVPPKLYGGIERVVHWLTEELVAMGHEVVLFASGDSTTSASLAPICEQALRLDQSLEDWPAVYKRMIDLVYSRRYEFDVLHFHIEHFPLSLFSRQEVPFVTTLHGRLYLNELIERMELSVESLSTLETAPLVSLSDSQRRPIPNLNWARTVANGMPANLLTPRPVKPDYAAFLGRMSPEKGVERAIHIACKAGLKLKIAAKVDNKDKDYYDTVIKPLVRDNPNIEVIGEIDDLQKPGYLSGAHAVLFPIEWNEPFGLVMIESMACGTPVIAFDHGAVPEVIDDGITGFIVRDVDSAAAAVDRLQTLDRAVIRATFERRFTSRRMAQDYLKVYETLTQRTFWLGKYGGPVTAAVAGQ